MRFTLRALVTATLLVLLGACALLPAADEAQPTPVLPGTPVPDAGPGTGRTHVEGSGRLQSEERSVSGFNEVSLSGIGNLILVQGEQEALTIEAEDNLLPLLTSEVQSGRLRLEVRPNSRITANLPITYRLEVTSLSRLEISGTGTVEATMIDTTALAVSISGSASATLSGSAGRQDLEMSGTGRFDGSGLAGRQATVEVSGTGQVLVNVSGRLEAEVSGTAVVRYLGDPEVRSQVSGLGRVERARA